MPWPGSELLLAPLAPWFEGIRRDLPWRAEDLNEPHPDPYAVLVSELMLQQTQVATVIPFFQRWMMRFPDAMTLASAGEDEIHKLWEGLGYYRRARLLQAAARRISDEGWPSGLESYPNIPHGNDTDPKEDIDGPLKGLLALPGLGPYTAAAVAAIAFQLPTAALDGNAFRVLSRLLGIEDDPRKSAALLREWLAPSLQAHGPSRLTQAIMELGATICTPSPHCANCPLTAPCAARCLNATDRIPARLPRKAPLDVAIWLLAVQSQGKWLLHPPTSQGLLAGLWRWPTLTFAPAQPGSAEEPLPFGLSEARTWPAWTQVYTHRREQIRPLALEFETPFSAPKDMVWLDERELNTIPMGRRDQRLQDLLQTPSAPKQEAPPVAELLKQLQSRP